jgi:hypothetical protein
MLVTPDQRNTIEGSITVEHGDIEKAKQAPAPRTFEEVSADLAVTVDALIEAERWFLRTERELAEAEDARAKRTIDVDRLYAELGAALIRHRG